MTEMRGVAKHDRVHLPCEWAGAGGGEVGGGGLGSLSTERLTDLYNLNPCTMLGVSATNKHFFLNGPRLEGPASLIGAAIQG